MEFIFYLFLAYWAGSFAEWLSHSKLMHSKNHNFLGVFDLHMEHHKAYPRDMFQWSTNPELSYKGLVLCLEHILIFMVPLALLALPFKPLLSLTFLGVGVLHFFLYNAIHPAEHLMTRPWFMPEWLMKQLVWQHFLHHQIPTKNFCVTLPGADWIMGTVAHPSFHDKREWVGIKNIIENNFPTAEYDRKKIRELDNCLLSSKTMKYLNNGYIAPPPGPEASLIGFRILQVMKFLFIGDIKVEGIQNLPQGPCVYAVSHDSWKDLFIMRYVLGNTRVMAALSVMRFLGLGFILGPFLGCFGAQGDGKGTAVNAAINMVKGGESCSICPQGWAYMDYQPRSFHTGAVRIARGAQVPVVPVFISYNAKPQRAWFLKLPFPLQVVFNALNPRQRKGVRVIIGEAIKEFPGDDKYATQFLEYKVNKLRGKFD